MKTLGLDFGSSSIKAGVLRNGRVVGKIIREKYLTHYDGVRAEVSAAAILKAVASAIDQLGEPARAVDRIALSVMSPSWVAMDKRGHALTPIVTHQDRRSVEIAGEIEKAVDRKRHLKIAGNRPFPGGISSTTAAWFARHEKTLMRKADLIGHLNTFINRQFTGARVTDPSNASFMGLFETTTQGNWSDELCEAASVPTRLLPTILPADHEAGRVTAEAARRFGLTRGTPVLVGITDTSSAMILAGAKVGQLLNVSGSTDVLALCVDRPVPHEQLLTRALGVNVDGQPRWMSVSTLAAAGSALNWIQRTLFSDLSATAYYKLIDKLANKPVERGIRFDPYLAGDRTSMVARSAAFSGLTLSTNRNEMLGAVIESLAQASAARLELLAVNRIAIDHLVMVSGGSAKGLGNVLHRDWKGRWSFHATGEATLLGLSKLGGN